MSLRRTIVTIPLVSLAVACASASIEPTPTQQPTGNMPTASDDSAILDAWMAASRGKAANKRAAEAEPFRPKGNETNPVRLVQWAVAQPDRQAGWRACLELKSQQDGSTSMRFPVAIYLPRHAAPNGACSSNVALRRAISPSPRSRCRTSWDTFQSADLIKYVAISKSAVVPEHPLLDYVSSLVATDPTEEFRYLEKVYAKKRRISGPHSAR